MKPMWSTPAQAGQRHRQSSVPCKIGSKATSHTGSSTPCPPDCPGQCLDYGIQSCGTLVLPTDGARHDRAPPLDARLAVGRARRRPTTDWDAADPALLRDDAQPAGADPDFEEYVLELAAAGLVHGPAHSSIGQEGGAVGSVLALTSDDTVNGSHRGHHQFLAKALHHVAPKGIDPTDEPRRRGPRRPAAHARRDLRPGPRLEPRPRRVDAPAVEGGRRDGHQRHRRRRGAAGRRVRVGAPAGRHRRGVGDLLRRRRRRTSARRWRPSTSPPPGRCRSASSSRTTSTPSPPACTRPPASRGCPPAGSGFGIASWKVDGMDPLAVHLAMQEAVAHMRRRQRARRSSRPTPTATSTRTARSPAARSATATKEEERAWRARDPLTQVGRPPGAARHPRPPTRSTPTVARAKQVMAEIGRDAPRADARRQARRSGGSGPAEWPDPAFVDVGVRGDLARVRRRAAGRPRRVRRRGAGDRSSSTRSPR